MAAGDAEPNPGPRPLFAVGKGDGVTGRVSRRAAMLVLVVCAGCVTGCVVSALAKGHTAVDWWSAAAVIGAAALPVLVTGMFPALTRRALLRQETLELNARSDVHALVREMMLTEVPALPVRRPSTLHVRWTPNGARFYQDLRMLNAELTG